MAGGKVIILAGAPTNSELDWEGGGLLTGFTEAFARFAKPGPLPPPPSSSPTAAAAAAAVFPALDDTAAAAASPQQPSYARWRALSTAVVGEGGGRARLLPTGLSQTHGPHHHYHYAFQLPAGLPLDDGFFTTATAAAAAAAGGASFAGVSEGTASEDERDVVSQFYDHSLSAVFDDDDDSGDDEEGDQDDGDDGVTASFASATTTSSDPSSMRTGTTGSFAGTAPSGAIVPPPAPRPPPPPKGFGGGAGPHLSDLEDVPPAEYVLGVSPQTVSVNLIVGVVATSPARSVRTRYGGGAVDLVELVVGDETRAGFTITFWLDGSGGGGGEGATGGGRGLRAAAAAAASAELREAVTALRARDVVLLQNVALRVFMGRVYGHSLRRGLTKVHVLFRAQQQQQPLRGEAARRVVGYYEANDVVYGGGRKRHAARGRRGTNDVHPQLEKTRRVWEWVIQFVGGGEETLAEEEDGGARGRRKRKGKQLVRAWDRPPPDDTQ